MRNTKKMKSIIKIAGIIAFAAVIGLTAAACSKSGGSQSSSGKAEAERKTVGVILSYKYGTWVKDDNNSTSLSFERISGQRLSTFILNDEQIIFQTYNANNDQVEIHVGPGFGDQLIVKAEFNSDGSKMYVTSVAYTGAREGSRDFSAANGTYTLKETASE